MKPHKFGEDIPCFGHTYQTCMSCGAISLDKDLAPYSDADNWMVVSHDCERAGKQIELLQKHQELEESRRFYLCW